MGHLGVEVATIDEVHAATGRLADAGLTTREENDTTCCHALQDKAWTQSFGSERWEVYVVKADATEPTPQQQRVCCAGSTAVREAAAGGGCC